MAHPARHSEGTWCEKRGRCAGLEAGPSAPQTVKNCSLGGPGSWQDLTGGRFRQVARPAVNGPAIAQSDYGEVTSSLNRMDFTGSAAG